MENRPILLSMPKIQILVQAKWKDRKLVYREVQYPGKWDVNRGPSLSQMKKKETWELKSDGRTMVQTISWQAEVGQGPAPMTKVYVKKSYRVDFRCRGPRLRIRRCCRGGETLALRHWHREECPRCRTRSNKHCRRSRRSSRLCA